MPLRLTSAAEALDAAIAESAATGFARLTESLDDEKPRQVAQALDSLHGSIRRLEVPEYADELVALFYSVWYQPFQVNAAYALIRDAIECQYGQLSNKERLHVVDFGSGALAMQFGLTLAVLDLSERGFRVPEISVSLFEPNDAMLRVGLNIWRRFLSLMGYDGAVDGAALTTSARIGAATIRSARITHVSDISVPTNSHRWLVAMHAYYADDRETIKRNLAQIHQAVKPDFGFLTCHHASLDDIRCVSPFAEPGAPGLIPPLPLSGPLPRVNSWRSALRRELGCPDETRLSRPTEWDPVRGRRDNRAILYVNPHSSRPSQ